VWGNMTVQQNGQKKKKKKLTESRKKPLWVIDFRMKEEVISKLDVGRLGQGFSTSQAWGHIYHFLLIYRLPSYKWQQFIEISVQFIKNATNLTIENSFSY
jgi:hypothetical protein